MTYTPTTPSGWAAHACEPARELADMMAGCATADGEWPFNAGELGFALKNSASAMDYLRLTMVAASKTTAGAPYAEQLAYIAQQTRLLLEHLDRIGTSIATTEA